MFLTEFTSPYSLNAQRGWHTSAGYCFTVLGRRVDEELAPSRERACYARVYDTVSLMQYTHGPIALCVLNCALSSVCVGSFRYSVLRTDHRVR